MLVDDHPLWRQTMRQLFEETGRVEVVAEASDGREAIEAVGSSRPDVVLMDIDMPGLDGVRATRAITAAHPQAKVLVLSASDARANVIGALAAGASGYLLKTAGANEIRDGVARVASGEVALPPTLAVHVVESLRHPKTHGSRPDPIEVLTERERDVLALMAEGHSNSAICNQFHLSPKTVEGYIASIFTKLELEPTRDQHRRVLAVLRFVESQARTTPS
jgi:DNA-binding NarL/FixJ family response regulator